MSISADAARRTADLARLREVLVMALAVTIPLSVGVVIWWAPGGDNDFNRRVSVSPFDVTLAVLIAVWVVDHRRREAPTFDPWTSRIAFALGAVLLLAFIAHPSPRGIDFAFHVAGALATVSAITRLDRDARRRVLAAIVLVGDVEAVIGMLESAKGGAIGLRQLEFSGFFYSFGHSTASHAGFDHPYHLACFLLVALTAALVGAVSAARSTWWLAAGAVIATGLATTYSRAALITLVALLLIAVLARGSATVRSTRRRFAVVVAAAFLVGAVGFGNGWVARAQQTTSTSGGTSVDSNRSERAREALRLVAEHPILGVGPGRYTIALQSVEHTALLPAHNAVLHEAAEAGVLGGVLTTALLAALAVSAIRRGPHALIVFSSLVLLFLVDAYPYVFPAGIALSGLWLGVQLVATDQSVARV